MSILLLDHFTDTNGTALTSHTMDIGAGWTGNSTNFQIQSNTAQAVTDPGYTPVVADAGQSDFAISVTINGTYTGTTDFALPDLALRYQDSNNYWLQEFGGGGGAQNHVTLYKRIAGSFTSVADTTFSYVDGTGINVRIIVNGANYTLYINGANTLTYGSLNSNFSGTTKVGFSGTRGGSPSTNSTWDDYQVESLVFTSDMWTPRTQEPIWERPQVVSY